MSVFKDAGHLFRFAGLFVLAFLVFLVVRHYVVPKSFGQYGHYRGAAIGEIAARPVKYAGHETCETCHADVRTMKKSRKTCARELRGLPRAAGRARRRARPSVKPVFARHGRALRPMPHGQRRQTQGLSAG